MNFTEIYQTYSNSQLLQIIDNAVDYQPEAVDAAKRVIHDRQLTAEDMDAAKKELAAGKQAEIEKARKQKEKEEQFKATGRSILENINPVKDTYPRADKVINVVTVVFGAIYLIWFIGQIRFIKYLFMDSSGFGWDMLAYLLQLIYMPITLVLFYKRKKSGWILFLLYLVASSATQLVALYRSIHWKPSGMPVMDALFTMNHPVVYILCIAFLAGTIWVICKKDVRSVFWKKNV